MLTFLTSLPISLKEVICLFAELLTAEAISENEAGLERPFADTSNEAVALNIFLLYKEIV